MSHENRLDCTYQGLVETCYYTSTLVQICILRFQLTSDDLYRVSEDDLRARNSLQNHLYCYLYSKHVLQTASTTDRKRELKALVDPATSHETRRVEYEERHQRLLRLLVQPAPNL